MLDARLDRRLGEFRLEAELQVAAGSTLALVGESGSGKTTVLRLLAGLARPDQGRIALGDSVLFDSERGIDLAIPRRAIGYVAQDYALFPHLTVAENVAFGLRAQGVRGPRLRARVAAMLARLAIAELASRRPSQLSGGQQQRVALARSLILEPELLLLDEPLAALDLGTRRALRAELRRLLAQLPCITIFVTHDPTEAMVFGDEIAVLESGRVCQVGPAAELLRRPRSGHVAELMGVNLLRGEVVERTGEGLAGVSIGGGRVVAPDIEGEGEIYLVIDPREIVISIDPPVGSAQNVFRGEIDELTPEPPLGERMRVVLSTRPALVAEITGQAARTLGLGPGRTVYASFKASGVTVFR